jgi:uncharacterized protein (DUF58 family)
MMHTPGAGIGLADLIALREEARRLDLVPRRRVLATRSGGHLSPFRGRGMEFDESRVYQPGDDPRNMDWRVTARAGTAHVKLFREERERPVWLAVDQGPGMRFGTRVAFKSVIAARAAALLAWAAADQGDRVGGLVFDGAGHFECRPVPRTRGLLPLLNALARTGDTAAAGAGATGPASLSGAAARLAQRVRPGSLVFLISDFAGLTLQDGAWLARLSGGSEVVLVQVFDPLEAVPPPPGRYPVTDGERQGVLDLRTTSRRQAWRQLFAERVALLEELGRRHHLHRMSLRTDQPVAEPLRLGLQPRPGGSGR